MDVEGEEGEENPTLIHIRSGLRITLKTHDPQGYPLPHPALLLLHSIISRVVTARGGADVFDEPYRDDLTDVDEMMDSGETLDGHEIGSDCLEPGVSMWIKNWAMESIQIGEDNEPCFPESQLPRHERSRPVHAVVAEYEDRELERQLLARSHRTFTTLINTLAEPTVLEQYMWG